ncbi:MAG: hypothetical protein ACM3SR_07390 [Ignavibacteriales bacterium]
MSVRRTESWTALSESLVVISRVGIPVLLSTHQAIGATVIVAIHKARVNETVNVTHFMQDK